MGKCSRVVGKVEGETARPDEVVAEQSVYVGPRALGEFLCAGLERTDLPGAVWRIVIVGLVKKLGTARKGDQIAEVLSGIVAHGKERYKSERQSQLVL